MFRKLVLAVTFVILALSLCGCGTIQGIGEDIQTLGQAIEDAVD